jgi:phosphonate transport system substrate-binding protein
MIITHKDSPIKDLNDLLQNGKRYSFGNGDPNSTSGYLVPGYYVFALNGIDPKAHFKRTLNANHETNALAVINKQVDAATNNTESMDRVKERWPERYEQVRILWKSPLIPSDPIVWRKDLPDETKAKVQRFFLEYGTGIVQDAKTEKAILAGLQWSGFRASDNAQLVPIRQLALFQEKTKVQGDATLAAEAKRQRLAEIDAQLTELNKQSGAK